ncbi:hypothetical protein O0I10_012913 [Lichtheimia ornata]|uniref:C2H2-type domain-containing protein n=1 Tax=Lichtheimia ornata TaxID=688661 RepID=A0AAD7URT8_9FUNG|nr:uncharacterized protein O0I10_012913 [Lichtheimia ornata]KAJ8651524.1 hypothetical protein O0I10_012913 [Lichtheimia ornata]
MNQTQQVPSTTTITTTITMPYSSATTTTMYDDPLFDLSCLLSSFSQDTFTSSPIAGHENDPHQFSHMHHHQQQAFTSTATSTTTTTMDNNDPSYYGPYVPPVTLPILEDAQSSTTTSNMSHASLSPTPSFPSSPYALSLTCNNFLQPDRPVDCPEDDHDDGTITTHNVICPPTTHSFPSSLEDTTQHDSPKRKNGGRRIKHVPPYASNMVNLYFPKPKKSSSSTTINQKEQQRRPPPPPPTTKVTKTECRRRMFTCDVEGCNKSFTRPYNLKSHKRTHTLERPFACAFCPKQFARQHDRNRHARLHTGIKAYICQHCQKGFARQDALNRHQRPTLDKGFPCCKKKKGK